MAAIAFAPIPDFSGDRRTVQNARVEPLVLRGPSARIDGGGPFECRSCKAVFDFMMDEQEFTGNCCFPAGRWMVRGDRLWHICHGYDENPSATKRIKIQIKKDG